MEYLRVGFINKRLKDFFFLTLTLSSYPCHSIYIYIYIFFFKESDFLTMLYFSAMLIDKNQVMPQLNFSNFTTLNFLLRLEIFVSEDGQLQAIHLILEFDPI